jgi:hypothetical protein
MPDFATGQTRALGKPRNPLARMTKAQFSGKLRKIRQMNVLDLLRMSS